MDLALELLRLLGGGALLYFGAEWLVRGSAGLARTFGVKPLVIGLTVVAYGTSMPELAVSGAAALRGANGIVLGNIIGSNIANLALILGLTALIAPPAVDGRLIRREVPVLVLATAAVPLTLLDGRISAAEGAVLAAAALAFTLYTLGVSSREATPTAEQVLAEVEEQEPPQGKLRLAALTVVGLGMLLGGGELFVDGARLLALRFGMSDRLVGLTVVAIGTSLPELAASLVAALRGYSSLAVGNVIGSNIFNVFLCLGVASMIHPVSGALSDLRTDLGFLIGVTILGVFLMRGSRRISRIEGALLTTTYAAFILLAALGW